MSSFISQYRETTLKSYRLSTNSNSVLRLEFQSTIVLKRYTALISKMKTNSRGQEDSRKSGLISSIFVKGKLKHGLRMWTVDDGVH